MNQQVAATTLTPQQRALLAGVAMPDVPGKPLPPIKIAQSNSPELLDSPDNEAFLEGAVAGGFVVPHREGRAFLPSPPGIRFQIFGWATVWHVYEKRPDGSNQRIGSHPEKPSGAAWREDATGKRACLDDDGNSVVETLGCFMRLSNGAVGRYDFSKTAKPIGDALATKSQRLSVESGEIKGSVLGRFQMTTRLKTEGARHWYLPVPTLLGKLGEKGGPALADVLACATLRQAFLEGAPLPELPETAAIAASPSNERPKMIVTSGRQALANPESPPTAPPPSNYDGPDDELSDPIPF
jgi:hypothetical protein